jgi:hypothetical protein
MVVLFDISINLMSFLLLFFLLFFSYILLILGFLFYYQIFKHVSVILLLNILS